MKRTRLFKSDDDLRKVQDAIRARLRRTVFDERDVGYSLDKMISDTILVTVTDAHRKDRDYKRLDKLTNRIADVVGTVAYRRRISDHPAAVRAMAKYEELVERL